MATSYKKKGATSKKRTKGSATQTGEVPDADGTIFGSALADQDPPIIIKPGGSLVVKVQNRRIGTDPPTNNTLGDPRRDPALPPGIHFRYDHNHAEYKLNRVTLFHPVLGEVPVGPANWDGYEIRLYYFT